MPNDDELLHKIWCAAKFSLQFILKTACGNLSSKGKERKSGMREMKFIPIHLNWLVNGVLKQDQNHFKQIKCKTKIRKALSIYLTLILCCLPCENDWKSVIIYVLLLPSPPSSPTIADPNHIRYQK